MLAAEAALQSRKFSTVASEIALQNTESSTCIVYDAKWANFKKWCEEQETTVVPEKVTPQQLADFLAHLRNTLKLKLSTIKGYRTAIASVLKLYKKENATSDHVIKCMMQSFKHSETRPSIRPPKWSLPLVLRMLNKPPFEPLGTAQVKYLTYKTVFLVLLGTGCRRSELHALDHTRLEHPQDWSWVDLAPSPEFRAKFQARDKDPSQSRVFRLQRILTSEDPEELLSCPVKALRCYVLRTNPTRGNRNALFLPIDSKSHKVTANTISAWIKNTINIAYQNASAEDLRVCQVPQGEPDLFRAAHEVRALGVSHAWSSGNTSLTSILQACYWSSHNVFTDFYLRDISVATEKGLRLASRSLPGAPPPP